MADLDITAARVRELLAYDPLTGEFTWRVTRCQHAIAGAKAGSLKKDGRVYITVGGRKFARSRLAWLHHYGVEPPNMVDHEDTEPSHDWIANLRLATNTENQQNQRRAHKGSRSGLLGVTWVESRRRWWARIRVGGKLKVLGYFLDKFEAHRAYVAAKARYHPFSTLLAA